MQDVGAYPTPWPVGTAAAVGMLFPGPYRVPAAGLPDDVGVLQHRRAHRVPRAVAVRVRSPARSLLDIAARRMGIDPIELRRRNLLRRDELPYTNPNGMPYSDITPSETFEQALEILDYDAFRREQAERPRGRPLPRRRHLHLRRADHHRAWRSTAPRARRSGSSRPGKVNVYVAGGSTGNSLETTVVQLTADALGVDIDDVRTIQGDTAVTPFGAGTGGSRSGSMIAGAVGADRGDPARADHRDRRPPARGRARRHRARRKPGPRPGHADDRGVARRDRRDRVLHADRAARRRAGRAGGQRPLPAPEPR